MSLTAPVRLRVLPKLIPLDGKSVEMQSTATQIQWRLVGDSTWVNLVALSDITGPKGDKGDTGATGSDGLMASVVAGSNVSVDNTDPANPVISAPNAIQSSATDASSFGFVAGKAATPADKSKVLPTVERAEAYVDANASSSVADRTALKALDTTVRRAATSYGEGGRHSSFVWRLGNYAAALIADNTNSYFVPAGSTPSANLLANDDFSGWTKTNITITGRTALAPNGVQEADTVLETAATGSHQFTLGQAFSLGDNTMTVYAKPIGLARRFRIGFPNGAFAASSRAAIFDLSTGTVVSSDVGTTATVTDAGGGWYRLRLTASCISAATSTSILSLYDATGSGSYTGDTSTGVALYGGRLELASSPADYGAWVNTAPVFNVQHFGASPDGVTDCGPAIQKAIDLVRALGGGTIYIPGAPGIYRVATSINLGAGSAVTLNMMVRGDGEATRLGHDVNGAAMFTGNGQITSIDFDSFSILPLRNGSSDQDGAFWFGEGIGNKATFRFIRAQGNGSIVLSTFFGIKVGQPMNGVAFIDCTVSTSVLGIRLGIGSSVHIIGGRLIGQWSASNLSNTGIGLDISGGNGGVWCWGVDIINNATNIEVRDAGGGNREIMFCDCWSDAGLVGLHMNDACYFTWINANATNGRQASIKVEKMGLLKLIGGQIFNSGNPANFGTDGHGYGMWVTPSIVNGAFDIDGVTFNGNCGVGIKVEDGGRVSYSSIRNCALINNGTATITAQELGCQAWIDGRVVFEGNLYAGTPVTANLIKGSTHPELLKIRHNTGEGTVTETIAVPASGATATNNTGRYLEAVIRDGAVTSIVRGGQNIMNSASAVAANCSFIWRPSETVVVNYTTAPVFAVRDM